MMIFQSRRATRSTDLSASSAVVVVVLGFMIAPIPIAFLPRISPLSARDGAIFPSARRPNDAVAGDGDRQSIDHTRLSHGAHGLQLADPLGDLGIAHGRAGWYLVQRFPDSTLEGSAVDIQRKVESDRRHLHEPHHLSDELLKVGITADELGFRELVLKVVDELTDFSRELAVLELEHCCPVEMHETAGRHW
jgi:hypothetical protein